jgi:hypothetical protein
MVPQYCTSVPLCLPLAMVVPTCDRDSFHDTSDGRASGTMVTLMVMHTRGSTESTRRRHAKSTTLLVDAAK